MLTRMDELGRIYDVAKLPYADNYLKWINLIEKDKFVEICSFIDETIELQNKYSVATLFGGDWPEPLYSIYEAVGCDSVNAGLLLGRINLDRVIRSDTKWFSAKTKLKGRDLATAFYWKK